MKRVFLGVGALALLAAAGYVWLNTPRGEPPQIASAAPLPVVTPEVLVAINKKLAIVSVDVPLESITFSPTANVERLLFWDHTIQSGRFLAGGKVVVGFDGSTIVRHGDDNIEITLGQPVTRALDDSFATLEYVENSAYRGEVDVAFRDKAREQGRQMLLTHACAFAYDNASAAGAKLLKDFVLKLSPKIRVVVHTTPAKCA